MCFEMETAGKLLPLAEEELVEKGVVAFFLRDMQLKISALRQRNLEFNPLSFSY